MTRTWHFVVLILLSVVTASALRVYGLNLRPMHTDEAVHSVKFDILWNTGTYEYDVHDFHGPTL